MKSLLIILALALTGCATNDYALYAKAQGDVEVARHNADAAKYKAMAEIAASGDQSAKVAAVMAMAMGQGSTTQQAMQAPQASTALQWAQVLVPGLTQVAGIAANMRVGLAQSDNSAKLGMSTNEAFVGIAGKIQAPVANVTTTTTSTDNHTSTTTTNPSSPTRVCGVGTAVLNCQ